MAGLDEQSVERALREAGDGRVTLDDFHALSQEPEPECDRDDGLIAVVLETHAERKARLRREARR